MSASPCSQNKRQRGYDSQELGESVRYCRTENKHPGVDDRGGQIVGSVELDKAIVLLKAVVAAQEDAEFAAMIERWEAQQDARHDAVSAGWSRN